MTYDNKMPICGGYAGILIGWGDQAVGCFLMNNSGADHKGWWDIGA